MVHINDKTRAQFRSSKRAVLHISDKCFVPFGVSIAFPKESVYNEKLNNGILMMLQSGILSKLESDVKWKMQRSSTGKLLQVYLLVICINQLEWSNVSVFKW